MVQMVSTFAECRESEADVAEKLYVYPARLDVGWGVLFAHLLCGDVAGI